MVGTNITNTNGVISLTSTNITNALGYTPFYSAEISATTTEQIDNLFFKAVKKMAKNSAEENSIAIESAQENLPPKKFYRYRIGD